MKRDFFGNRPIFAKQDRTAGQLGSEQTRNPCFTGRPTRTAFPPCTPILWGCMGGLRKPSRPGSHPIRRRLGRFNGKASLTVRAASPLAASWPRLDDARPTHFAGAYHRRRLQGVAWGHATIANTAGRCQSGASQTYRWRTEPTAKIAKPMPETAKIAKRAV